MTDTIDHPPLIRLGNIEFIPDVSGALYAPTLSLLVVADLHFEKGSSLARRGRGLLPPYDTIETINRLSKVIERLNPTRVISLGDTWHEPQALARMTSEDVNHLRKLQRDREWSFISGNHDSELPHGAGFMITNDVRIEGIAFRHEPKNTGLMPEISGHFHPVVRVKARGRALRRRCFVANDQRCILPAFGAYTGGLNILDDAFMPLINRFDATIFALGTDRVYRIGSEHLIPD